MNQFPLRIYTDGATIGRNPSVIGGAYAIRVVLPNDTPALELASYVSPSEFNACEVTSNSIELYALMIGISLMNNYEIDVIYTDSQVSISRIKAEKISEGLKELPLRAMLQDLREKHDTSKINLVRVASHPTKMELQIGHRNGTPVSKHNVWCDKICRRISDEVLNGKRFNRVHRLLPGSEFLPLGAVLFGNTAR